MAKDRQNGKLAILLHADVAGSTQLVQKDEHLTHDRIQDAFNRFGNTISQYSGRVLELRGDALLAEFEKPSDSIAATLAFQTSHSGVIDALEDDLKPEIRVGIAMGEVVIADNTVTGAGVVLAQRVEQLASKGGLCITAAIHEALSKRLPFELKDLGEQNLKGFDYPVRVYRVSLSSGEKIPGPKQNIRSVNSLRSRKILSTVSVVALVIAVGAAFWFRPWQVREDPASLERMAFPLPDKPSIAVLPFTNLSDSKEQEYFADGMTEDLITDISKISGLFIIARNSVFTYKGKTVKVQQVAEELGVRYVLEGSVRRAGDQVRINAQLIDATTGGHVWAERYDGSLSDVFSLQDQVTTQIVEAMSVKLTARERKGLGSFGTSNVAAHDAFLQGLSFYLRNTPADNAKAEPHLLRAVELDPGFARAYATLAKVYFKSGEREYSRAIGIVWHKAIYLAYKNLENIAETNITEFHVLRSWMALNKHQLGIALGEAEKALKLNPNDVDAMKAKARVLIYSGQYEQGRKLANSVIRLDPVAIAEPLYILGLSYFAAGDYDKAADYLNKALENDPETSAYTRLLAAAYGKLGRELEAKAAWQKFRDFWHWPVWIAAEVYSYPFEDDEVLRNLAEGLNLAGVAERPPSRYLKLGREYRLQGHEVKSLLFGHAIKGQDFWIGTTWEQSRTIDGKVSHSGTSFHTENLHDAGTGESWIEDDRLCDRRMETDGSYTVCVLIFRDADTGEKNYFMMTDTGPHPFQVSG